MVVLARDRCRPFTTADVARVTDDVSAVAAALLDRAAGSDEADLEGGLDDMLDPRTDVVPRAVGLVSHLEGLDRAGALRHLKTTAFAQGSTLQQVAHDLLARHS